MLPQIQHVSVGYSGVPRQHRWHPVFCILLSVTRNGKKKTQDNVPRKLRATGPRRSSAEACARTREGVGGEARTRAVPVVSAVDMSEGGVSKLSLDAALVGGGQACCLTTGVRRLPCSLCGLVSPPVSARMHTFAELRRGLRPLICSELLLRVFAFAVNLSGN